MSERVEGAGAAGVEFPETDDTLYLYGAAVPEADGWINPHRVSTTGTAEGAKHRAEVLGEGFVVVRRLVTEWEQVSWPGQPAQPTAAPSAAGGADGGAGRG